MISEDKTKSITTKSFAAAMANLDIRAGQRIAVAVSGGADSLALALLLKEWGADILALTVDHRLRKGSDAEAQVVGEILADFDIPHRILTWEGEKPETKIQEQARRARYNLLLEACRGRNISTLALAHHQQDQMETFWMRLAAGSGLDGLCAMAAVRDRGGVTLIRPLLSFSKESLYTFCQSRDVAWVEDPTNENKNFLRPRLRDFEDMLAAEGLTPARLSKVLQKLVSARDALRFYTDQAYDEHVIQKPEGGIVLKTKTLSLAPVEIQRRVLIRCLQQVNSQDYSPRFDALEALRCDILSGNFAGRTLAGCILSPHKEGITISRETKNKKAS